MFHQPVPVAYGVMPHQHSMYSYHELENSALTAAAAEHQQLDEKEAYKLAALRQAVLSPAGNPNKAQVIYEQANNMTYLSPPPSNEQQHYISPYHNAYDMTPTGYNPASVYLPVSSLTTHHTTTHTTSPPSAPNQHQLMAQSAIKSQSESQQSQIIEQATPRPSSHEKIICTLSNKDLWMKFSGHTTEMIITKQGRRMFPTLQYTLKGLNPNTKYSVMIDVGLSNSTQWKYQSGKWIPSGQMASQMPKSSSFHVHPNSPNTGAHFMKQDITFAKMKLTNSKTPEGDQVVLSSMHKYQPRLVVSPQDGSFEPQIFSFPETEFIAVTAYQNTTITQLKIDHNPFAKGFRDSSYDRMGGMLNIEPAPAFQRPSQTKSYYSAPSQTANYESEIPKTTSAYYNQSQYYCNSHVKTVTADMYGNQYYRQASQDNEDQGYRPQLGMDQMQIYHQGMNYHQWYQSQYMPQTSIPTAQQQEPNQSHITSWLRNVEDNAHLQQSTETPMPYEYTAQQPYDLAMKTEDGEPSASKRGIENSSSEWISQQPPKKRALWNNYQPSSSPQEAATQMSYNQGTNQYSNPSIQQENSNHLTSPSASSMNQSEVEQHTSSIPISCAQQVDAPPAQNTVQPSQSCNEEITVDDLPNPSVESSEHDSISQSSCAISNRSTAAPLASN